MNRLLGRLVLLFCVGILMIVPDLAAELNGGVDGVDGVDLGTLFPGATFADGVPSQVEVTGVAPAQRPLRPEEALQFFERLAKASPRASLMEYARSHEGRPLVVLAVSDEQTIAELDQFKARHAELLDPRVPEEGKLESAKAVAWLAYGIHGDELSSTDAAASVAYWLIAGEDERAQALRDRLVILIDPNENPDGRARYLAQIQSFAHRTANPDQDDLSHTSVWPWGRGNHYLFDMNRDWFTMTQPESARSRLIGEWLPQLVVDSHEMGGNSTYLFAPPRDPFNPHLPPNVRKWEEPFSEDQARALDERGYPHFTGEWNEEFFPGYGSSWAAYHGAIGILYEMSRTSGTVLRKHDNTLRTYGQAVEHQVVSSVANLESLAASAAEIVGDQRSSRQDVLERGSTGDRRCWVFPADERASKLAELLTYQGVDVEVLAGKAVRATGFTDLRTGRKSDVDLQPGAVRVRLDQPAGHMVRVLLDAHVPMSASFLREEREYQEKGKGSRLYETTAWSMPLAQGVEAFWGANVPGGQWQEWAPEEPDAVPALTGSFTSVVFDGTDERSLPLLVELLTAGVTVRVAEKPFTVAGRSFDRGAFVVRKEGNPEALGTLLTELGPKHGVELLPVNTSRAEEGPDLGGSHFVELVAPRVGVLGGMPISPTAYGEVWHLFDQDLDLRFSGLDVGRISRADLARYNVLVLPPIYGGPAAYRHLLGANGISRLKRWIEGGGTAIGFGGGARLLADLDSKLTKARFRGQALDQFPSPVWSLSAEEVEAAGRPVAVGLRVSKGDAKAEKAGSKPARRVQRANPYDVASVLGPGALPFADADDLGTPLGGAPVGMKQWLKGGLPSGQKEAGAEDLERADRRLRSFMPQGALLRVDLDQEHWLSYGLGETMTVWFGSDDTIVAKPPVAVAARFPDIEHLHRGGLLWPEAAARMAQTSYATREAVGRGQVILFAEAPAYRRWMKESERMLVNAVLLGPGLGTRWSTPW